MKTALMRICLASALALSAPGIRSANSQDLSAQEWLLDPSLSNVYMQTVKNNATFETHQFAAVEGNISRNAEATVRIELASINTNNDLRDVRMRFLLFETFKFPHAVVTATLDKDKLRELSSKTRVSYPLSLKVAMHGVVRDIKADVWVTRISDSTVSVATIKPIIVTAESFGLTTGIAKLAEAVGGIPIASAASLSFDLLFGSGSLARQLGTARVAREAERAVVAARGITATECETRFDVISKTGAIYFETGSAELDDESAPLLSSVTDIAKRCPAVVFGVEGHTDTVGSRAANQRLSELRAKAVADYLKSKGIQAARVQSSGYGDTRPIAANNSETNRAKNRRIEFKVKKD